MHRREMLRLLSTSAMTPVLSPSMFAFFRQAQPGSDYSLKTLNSHQNETVVVMTELLVPATDTPGAKAAKVNEFIDVILTDWALPQERAHFLEGIASVDKASNSLYGKNFVDATPEQQTTLLRSMDNQIDWDHRRRVRRSGSEQERDTQLQGEFFRVFKTITFHGYYTSEIGFTQDLKLEIIPGAQHGCIPVPERKKA